MDAAYSVLVAYKPASHESYEFVNTNYYTGTLIRMLVGSCIVFGFAAPVVTVWARQLQPELHPDQPIRLLLSSIRWAD